MGVQNRIRVINVQNTYRLNSPTGCDHFDHFGNVIWNLLRQGTNQSMKHTQHMAKVTVKQDGKENSNIYEATQTGSGAMI